MHEKNDVKAALARKAVQVRMTLLAHYRARARSQKEEAASEERDKEGGKVSSAESAA
jgi:hypothetical protein